MVRVIRKLKKFCESHRLLRFRHRYIYTKKNTLRLRYLCGHGVFLALAVVLAIKNSQAPFNQNTPVPFELALAVDNTILDEPAAAPSKGPVGWEIAEALQSRISSGIRKASVAIQKATGPRTQMVELGAGDTIAGALENAGVSRDDAYQAVKVLSAHFDPRTVRAGQVINVQFRPGAESQDEFARLSMDVGSLKQVTVTKESGSFSSATQEKSLQDKTYAGYARIESSLYGSAERAGIPPQVLGDLIKIYSRTIDFQRDIRQGDQIQVLYDGKETEDGEYAQYGNILYANLTVGGRSVPIYRFETQDGRVDYFDEKGRTTRKTLLKTPVDGARISSGFGMRLHPILGYTKMHKGVDFAAPTGTPIYAAGDGTVTFAGRKNGYGNYVSIRHTSGLSTAYGHMYRFASATKPGARVRQGDVIGYVGATGRATGPHLHYEVLANGRQVNPRSVDLPTGENLAGRELARFKRTIGSLTQQYAAMTQSMKLAASESGHTTGHGLN